MLFKEYFIKLIRKEIKKYFQETYAHCYRCNCLVPKEAAHEVLINYGWYTENEIIYFCKAHKVNYDIVKYIEKKGKNEAHYLKRTPKEEVIKEVTINEQDKL